MIKTIILLTIGAAFGAVAVMVYACCRVSADISRRVERWNDED